MTLVFNYASSLWTPSNLIVITEVINAIIWLGKRKAKHHLYIFAYDGRNWSHMWKELLVATISSLFFLLQAISYPPKRNNGQWRKLEPLLFFSSFFLSLFYHFFSFIFSFISRNWKWVLNNSFKIFDGLDTSLDCIVEANKWLKIRETGHER